MGLFSEILTITKADEDAAKEFLKEIEIDVLARTLWGEARSEGKQGIIAVACVILNRVAKAKINNGQYWWGHDIVTICQRPFQFSCWNPGDINRKKLLSVNNNDKEFSLCLDIAKMAVEGNLGNDITFGADHYHTIDILPYWAKGKKEIARIGRHIFYRLEK